MTSSPLEKLSQGELARYATDVLRLIMLHYGIWFNEVTHQLGLEEAIRTEKEAFAWFFPMAVNRLSRTLGVESKDGLPAWLVDMEKEKLISLIKAMSTTWQVSDGVWFRTVENHHDMDTSKRCNDTSWTRYAPLEAAMIKSFLQLPEQSGLDGLEQALQFRLDSHIHKQTIERQGNDLNLRTVKCLVQEARRLKQLPPYPCRSAGMAKFKAFAGVIDARIRVECIGCPPDEHSETWVCAWRFSIIT